MVRIVETYIVAIFFMLAPLTSTAIAEKSAYWILQEKIFLCLKNSVEIYLDANKSNSPQDRILIFANKCPETNIAKLFAERTQNTSSLPFVEMDGQSRKKPAEIISLLPRQLRCLKSLDLKVENKLVQLPKEPCK